MNVQEDPRNQKSIESGLSHDILLHKLEHVSIRGTPLNWFKSYLTNRNQNVHVDDVHS